MQVSCHPNSQLAGHVSSVCSLDMLTHADAFWLGSHPMTMLVKASLLLPLWIVTATVYVSIQYSIADSFTVHGQGMHRVVHNLYIRKKICAVKALIAAGSLAMHVLCC